MRNQSTGERYQRQKEQDDPFNDDEPQLIGEADIWCVPIPCPPPPLQVARFLSVSPAPFPNPITYCEAEWPTYHAAQGIIALGLWSRCKGWMVCTKVNNLFAQNL